MARKQTAPVDRFWRFVKRSPGGCWLWQGALTPPPKGKPGSGGYGLFYDGTKLVGAHQWSYEHFVEPLPLLPNGRKQGLDHFKCNTPACVNWRHLRPASPRENTLRGTGITSANLAKTHCSAGHRYDESNTYIDKTGRRHCRICSRERTKRWYDQHGKDYHRKYQASRR